MLKQSWKKLSVSGERGGRGEKSYEREVGVDATHVDAMGDDDDREGEDADGEEEFEKVTDEMMADANDVLEEDIRENSIELLRRMDLRRDF